MRPEMAHLWAMTHVLPLAAMVILALTAPARAQNATGDVVNVSLIPGWRMADGTHVAGLAIRLAPGWKTYWRSPGDAGIPPRIDWAGSDNLGDAAIRWPVPVVFEINGLISVGYDRDVILPVVLTPVDRDAPISLQAQVTLGVCETICIPVDVQVTGTLPPAGTVPGAALDSGLSRALADVPLDAAAARMRGMTCDIAASASGLRLTAALVMPALGPGEFAVVETADPEIWVAEADVRRVGGTLHVSTEMQHVAGAPIALDRSGLRVTVLAGGRAADIRGCD